MDFELRYLPAFRAVCETGSLRAAAQSLHRTEQAVSYQLRRLEERLGTPLFDRQAGRLTPNARGLRLLDFCRGMHRDWSRVRDALDAAADDAPLRIAAVSGFGRYVLLPLFRDGPLAGTPLRMHYPTAPEVARSVAAGHADLGFVHCPQPPGRLVQEPVAQEEIVAIGSPGTAIPEPGDLQARAFVTYDESDYVFATWFAQVCGTAVPSLHATAHFEELEEVLAWVAAGRGVSIVPADCALAAAGRGEIAVLRWPERRCRNAIHALHDPSTPLPSAALDLLRALRERRLSDA
ncbi:LysR family transcriptional regulator [Fulvimonas yonginensis]|uniref:LysR family transcriptional regulator n=1 Tax=Fulvimonas yonginensis TaxID=1495200 RepID=A0ABU8JF46_9GAMM